MLDVLHVRELEMILTGGVVLRQVRSHAYLVEAIHQRFTGPQIIKAVCAALRVRNGFAVGSDPPITAAISPPVPQDIPAVVMEALL